jgi:uncharacterized protein YndB with AHSA1/START domain
VTVISSNKDVDALTLTFVAEFDADVKSVWQVWADPRRLERWWGPPTWPATFEQHDFLPGGESRYHMTGPEGEKAHGWWRIIAIDEPHRLEFDDGFADSNGEPDTTMRPMRMEMALEPIDHCTRMTTVTRFADADQLEKVLAMGMEEGMRLAMGQIDALLADVPA